MPEDIKKAIVVCVTSAATPQLYEGAKDKTLPGLARLMQQGTWAADLTAPGAHAAVLATLATGASPSTHEVDKVGDNCRAEYLWEAAQRSSKKTVLFGFPADRLPAREASPEASSAGAVASYLLTSPDWDLCYVLLGGEQGIPIEASAQAIDKAVAGILGVADDETLSVVVVIPESGSNGFLALAGSGVRQGGFLKRSVGLEDVVPTVCYLGELSVPVDCEGGIVYQAIEDPDMKIKELRACRRNYERLRRSSGPSAMC